MDMEIPYKATLDDDKPKFSDGGIIKGQVPPKPCPPLTSNKTPDGWTRWDGGVCPLPPRTPIEIRSREGNQHVGFAGVFRWNYTGTAGDVVSYRLLPELQRRRTDARPVTTAPEQPEQPEQPEYTGSDVNYYLVDIPNPKRLAPYQAECEDIIEALGLNFAEGCAFKAIWRRAAARQGRVKKGYTDGLYDAEKVQYYGGRMVAQEKRKLAGDTK